jgi:hypothetical protein
MPDDLKFDEELDLPSLYWIPKLHKCPFKQCYIAVSILKNIISETQKGFLKGRYIGECTRLIYDLID